MNKIQNAFDCVKADECLKSKTLSYIHNSRNRCIEKKMAAKRYLKYSAVCACVLIILSGYGTYSLFTSPVSYISIDINPSFELSLNCFDRVITASAYNDESEQILNSVDLNGKNYTDAVDTLLSSSEMEKYLIDDSELSFTVISENDTELIDGIENCSGFNKYSGQCKSADIELKNEAFESGLSFGKYRAYLELHQYDNTITADDCKNMTMREIYDLIDEHTGNAGTPKKHRNGMNNNGGGNGKMQKNN